MMVSICVAVVMLIAWGVTGASPVPGGVLAWADTFDVKRQLTANVVAPQAR